MRRVFRFWLVVMSGLACMSACTEAEIAGEDATAAMETKIAPTDFVLAPCDRQTTSHDCIILAAGGKRVLLGAPAGVGAGKIAGDDIPLDGVILWSLRAEAIEGLDEVRNRSWLSARRGPLLIAGEDGVDQIVTALNEAYITSDALAYIEGKRAQGGFDQDAIVAQSLQPGDIAFDTGDLTVTAFSGGTGRLALFIQYNDRNVFLAGCGAGPEVAATWPEAELYMGCEYETYAVPRIGEWPLVHRVEINQ